jgi:hypothetical protein
MPIDKNARDAGKSAGKVVERKTAHAAAWITPGIFDASITVKDRGQA